MPFPLESEILNLYLPFSGTHTSFEDWNRCQWDEMICACAAQNGHLELLQWVRAHQCPWDEMTCFIAAENGHLELQKWARSNDFAWNAATSFIAALTGRLELLKWARENGCLWDEKTYDAGRGNGDPALMH